LKGKLAIFLLSALFLASCSRQAQESTVQYTAGDNPHPKLSDYNFFKGPMDELNPNSRVLPFELISPLFTDYAEKARFIWMPENVSGMYNDSTFFDLPIGTILVKNFYFPDDFRIGESERRIIETRLMVHEPAGWRGLPYIWNDEQSEAYLRLAGGEKEVRFTDSYGEEIQLRYLIPNANQCQSCHLKNGEMVPIGPQAQHLNKTYMYNDGPENQLVRWYVAGFFSNRPDLETAPAIADYKDHSAPLNLRARAYLDINCAHCHNPAGPGKTSGLYLHYQQENPTALGVYKPPVAAGRGSGGKQFSIVPGNPGNSILLYRMESTEPGIMMPEIGRTIVDKEAVELIRAWIAEMEL
jgi:uncharacterized repeat protein (TIGR03806 family)